MSEKVVVVGAGTMGTGIAQIAAEGGYVEISPALSSTVFCVSSTTKPAT